MSAKSIVKNTLYMYSGEFISKICQFIFIILLTRYLGAEGYGRISFALSFSWILITFSDFGIGTIIFRETSANAKKTIHHISHSLSLKLILGTIAIIGTFILMFLFQLSKERIIIAMIISISFMLDSTNQLLRVAIISSKNLVYESIIKIIFGTSKIFIFLILYYLHSSIVAMASIYLLSSLITSLATFALFKRQIGNLKFKFGWKYNKWLLSESYPLLFAGIFSTLMFNTDILLLTWLKGDYATGIYSAPSRLIMNGFVFSEILVVSIFPYLVTYLRKSKEVFLRLCRAMTSCAFIVFIPICVLCISFSGRIVEKIFGTDYLSGSIILGISSLMLFFQFFTVLFGSLFVIVHRVKLATAIGMIAALLNLILNYALINLYSSLGAAIATTTSYAFLPLLEYYLFSKYSIKIGLIQIIFRSTLVFLLIFALAYSLHNIHLLLILPIILIVHLVLVFAFRIIPMDDLVLMLRSMNLNTAAQRIQSIRLTFFK